MFNHAIRFLAVLGLAAICMGMVQPRATQISVSTNSFSRIVGTNAQSALDWIDDNMLDQTSGYVTVAFLNSRYYSSYTNQQTWTDYATQSFGGVILRGDMTNTSGAAFGRMKGVVVDMPSTYTSIVSHTAYTNLTNIVTETFDGDSWYDGTNITPVARGYYLLGATACVTGNSCTFRWKYSTNTFTHLMTVTNDGNPVSGSTVMYADGTNSFSLQLKNLASGNTCVTNLRFFATFLGR